MQYIDKIIAGCCVTFFVTSIIEYFLIASWSIDYFISGIEVFRYSDDIKNSLSHMPGSQILTSLVSNGLARYFLEDEKYIKTDFKQGGDCWYMLRRSTRSRGYKRKVQQYISFMNVIVVFNPDLNKATIIGHFRWLRAISLIALFAAIGMLLVVYDNTLEIDSFWAVFIFLILVNIISISRRESKRMVKILDIIKQDMYFVNR